MHKLDEIEISEDEPVYPTGVVSRILKIPVWILKRLDRAGVVSPPRKRIGQTRLYSKRQLKNLQNAWYYMKVHKVKIPGLKVIFKLEAGELKD